MTSSDVPIMMLLIIIDCMILILESLDLNSNKLHVQVYNLLEANHERYGQKAETPIHQQLR